MSGNGKQSSALGSAAKGGAETIGNCFSEIGKVIPKLIAFFLQCVSSGKKTTRLLAIVFGMSEAIFAAVVGADKLGLLAENPNVDFDAILGNIFGILGLVALGTGSVAAVGFLIALLAQLDRCESKLEKSAVRLIFVCSFLSDAADLAIVSQTLIFPPGLCPEFGAAEVVALIFLVASPIYSNVVKNPDKTEKKCPIGLKMEETVDYIKDEGVHLVFGMIVIPGVFGTTLLVARSADFQQILPALGLFSGVLALVGFAILYAMLFSCSKHKVSVFKNGICLHRANLDLVVSVAWGCVVLMGVLLAFGVLLEPEICNELFTFGAYAFYNASTLVFFLLRGFFSGTMFEANYVKSHLKRDPFEKTETVTTDNDV